MMSIASVPRKENRGRVFIHDPRNSHRRTDFEESGRESFVEASQTFVAVALRCYIPPPAISLRMSWGSLRLHPSSEEIERVDACCSQTSAESSESQGPKGTRFLVSCVFRVCFLEGCEEGHIDSRVGKDSDNAHRQARIVCSNAAGGEHFFRSGQVERIPPQRRWIRRS